MNTELSTEEKRAQLVEFVPDNISITPMQFIGLIADQILGRDKQGNYRPANDMKLFLYQCKRTGLDPLARQIYAVYRTVKVGDAWVDKMTIQSSIDGLRLIAERTGKFAGQDVIKYEYDKDGILTAATATVYKITSPGTPPFPTSAQADWDEYKQVNREGQPMGLWGKMPKAMLGKVAEALALRKAFPQEMSGLYTSEEMAQATIVHSPFIAGPTTGDTNDGKTLEPVKVKRGTYRLAQAVAEEEKKATIDPEAEINIDDIEI